LKILSKELKNVIKPINIGSKKLKNNLFLAPMLGFTNISFREKIQEITEINLFSEMIPINPLSKDSNYCKDIIKRSSKEKYLFYQFFGNDEEKLVKSIENMQNIGIKLDFININCGCPAADIIKQGAGSALLKRESKIHSMIEKCKKQYSIPVTIKIRTGFETPKHLNYKKLEDVGCDAIFIHGRTKKQQYSGKVDLEYIKEAKENTNIPIIANGDIKNKETLLNIHNDVCADGYMIGRAALSNPFVFREILYSNYCNFKEKEKFLLDYYNRLKKYGYIDAFQLTKVLSLFISRNIQNGVRVREKISKTKDIDSLMEILINVKEL